jgi:hypothetical protein
MLEEVTSSRQAHFSCCPMGVLLKPLPCSPDAGFHRHLPAIGTLHSLPCLMTCSTTGTAGIKKVVDHLGHLVL